MRLICLLLGASLLPSPAPTGTGLGDRGVGGRDRRPYGPAQSPVQGGPPFDSGPTGQPLDLPREGQGR